MTTDTVHERRADVPTPSEQDSSFLGRLRKDYASVRPFVRRATFGLEGKKDIKIARHAGYVAAKSAIEEFQGIISIDPLSGVLNKKAFLDALMLTAENARGNNENLKLLFIDLNRFKLVNDQLGHDVGDQVIHEFGKLLAEHIRPSDIAGREEQSIPEPEVIDESAKNIAGRFGGDEFILLLKKSDNRGIRSVFKRLKIAMNENSFFQSLAAQGIDVTISVGAVTVNPDNPIDSLRNADLAMYQAKSINHENNYTGNQLIIYDPLIE